ncbi:MAG: hypothetical protein M1821_004478 [Bathelium mastoideum]|nr:MAG: hypothetical protein M1821_004478 [Bathelium mastoideum]
MYPFVLTYFIFSLLSFGIQAAPIAGAYQNIVAELAKHGIELETASWHTSKLSKEKDEEITAATKHWGHETPANSKIPLPPVLASFINKNPDQDPSVAIFAIETSTKDVVGWYNFDLGANFDAALKQKAENEMFPVDSDQAVLGLKWIQGPYRGMTKIFGTRQHAFNLNMAMTEVGWIIMENEGKHTKADTFFATTAGQKSGTNAGFDKNGHLVLSSRASWSAQTEKFSQAVSKKNLPLPE